MLSDGEAGNVVSEASHKQKLATIVSIDVEGYSKGMEADQQAMFKAIEALDLRVKEAAKRRGGRIFNTAGDGFMLEFPAVSDAVLAAEEIASGPWPPVRVGVHIGQVDIRDNGDLLGHGVNVSARIQAMAESGAVLISDNAKQALQGNPLSKRLKSQGAVKLPKMNEVMIVHTLLPADGRAGAGRRMPRRGPMIAAAVAAVLAVAAGGWLITGALKGLSPKPEKLAVMRFDSVGKEAGDIAELVTGEIRDTLGGGGVMPTLAAADSEAVKGAGASRAAQLGVALTLNGSVTGSGSGVVVKIHLDDAVNSQQIWGHEFPPGDADSLRAVVPARVTTIIYCYARATRSSTKLENPNLLAIYLRACDLDLDAADNVNKLYEQERLAKQLTASAPNFSYGHSMLADVYLAEIGSNSDQSAVKHLREMAAAEADKALQGDGKNSDAGVARATLAQISNPPAWAEREKFLSVAAGQESAGSDPPGQYALLLAEVGRMSEAATWSQKAVAADSWEPDYLALSASLLMAAGRVEDAQKALNAALMMGKGRSLVEYVRFQIAENSDRWDDAESILDSPSPPPELLAEGSLTATRAFIKAAKSRDPALIAAARDAEVAAVVADRNRLLVALSHLSKLGLVDDAFALAERFKPLATDRTFILFEPLMGAMRADPRFEKLATEIGLTAYWETSKHWPDFCNGPCRGKSS